MTEAPNETFRKVYIKTENDLPKESGKYLVSSHFGRSDRDPYYRTYEVNRPAFKKFWLNYIDWYLQPVEQEGKEELSESELKLFIIDLLRLNKSTKIDNVKYFSEDTVCNIIRRVVKAIHPSSETSKTEKCPCKDQTCFVDSDNDLLGCKYPSVEPSEQRTAEVTISEQSAIEPMKIIVKWLSYFKTAFNKEQIAVTINAMQEYKAQGIVTDDYKAKYEKCISVIKRFDPGIIGMYDL